jgi:hypothetical protein
MTHLPVTRDLESSMKASRRGAAIDAVWRRIVTVTTNPDLLAVVLFCVVGLGLTINLLLRRPDLAAITQQLEMFP